VESSVPGFDFSRLELRVMKAAELADPIAPERKGVSLANVPQSQLRGWRQELDLRRGFLRAEFGFEQLEIRHEVFALRQMPHTAVIRITIRAGAEAGIDLRNVLDTPEPLRFEAARFTDQLRDRRVALMTIAAKTPANRHLVATSTSLLLEGAAPPPITYSAPSFSPASAGFQRALAAGESLTVYLIASTCTSQDFADPMGQAERLTIFALIRHPRALVEEHMRQWEGFWARTDISVEGQPEVTKDIRLAMFMLNSFVNPRRPGTSTAAMGLGRDSWGWKILWDADFWIYPAILLTNPEAARAMLEYRFRRLDQARRNAAAYGYAGAMFPWESGESGEEQTPLPYLTTLQHQVTGAVGLAFWQYFCTTQDRGWLRERGYPVLQAVADFWVSRGEKNGGGEIEIRHVVGSDEHAVDIHNDAFTNGVAKAVLEAADRAAAILGEPGRPAWRETANRIVIRRFPDGTIKEHDNYAGAMIKQADAELLAFPLGVLESPEEIARTLRYYEPRLDPRGPNMSRFMYAGAAARAGLREEAARLFDQALRPYRRPPFSTLSLRQQGTSTYFGTSAGGFLQAVILGFGGLHFTEKGLVQRTPLLPAGWRSLTLKGIGNQQTLRVTP
jgi:trehalose/maltose hydrolase-like predicted phosphorylase